MRSVNGMIKTANGNNSGNWLTSSRLACPASLYIVLSKRGSRGNSCRISWSMFANWRFPFFISYDTEYFIRSKFQIFKITIENREGLLEDPKRARTLIIWHLTFHFDWFISHTNYFRNLLIISMNFYILVTNNIFVFSYLWYLYIICIFLPNSYVTRKNIIYVLKLFFISLRLKQGRTK